MATKQVNIDIIAKDKTRQAMRSATVGLNNLKNSVFNLQNALIGLGAGLVAKSFIDTGREVERLQVRFKFLFNEAKEGEKAFKGLIKFASEVPFSLEEIQRGSANLAVVSKDAEELNRLLKITGDIASASGLDFQTTAEQIQRTFSGGINSADLFRERGVRALLGFEAGVAISAEESRKHIMKAFDEGTLSVVGASETMAQTFDGTLSMIGDKFNLFKMAVMDASPFEFLKASAQTLNDALEKNFGSIERSAEAIGEAIVGATVKTLLFGAKVIDAFRPTFKFIGDSITNLANTVTMLPTPIPQIGLLGFLMLGKKGKIGVAVIASQIQLIQDLIKTTLEVAKAPTSLGMFALVPTLTLQARKAEKALDDLKETAGELSAPFEEGANVMEIMASRGKVAFKEVGLVIDENSVKAGSSVEGFLKIIEVIDSTMQANKKLKEESAQASIETDKASKARSTALAKEKKQIMDLADAMQGAKQAVLDALDFQDTGLFSNFSKGFKEVADSQKEMFAQMRDIGASTFDRLKTSLTDFVMTGKLSFADLGTFVVRSMVEMFIGEAIKNAMKSSLAMFKADSIKKAFISLYEGAMKTFASIPFPFNIGAVGGALAFGAGIINKIKGFEKGGRPPVGQPSIVGEKGAELFVPDQAGTIVPNDKLGMGKEVTVNFNISTVDARGFNELLVNSRGTIVNMINSAVNEKGRMAII